MKRFLLILLCTACSLEPKNPNQDPPKNPNQDFPENPNQDSPESPDQDSLKDTKIVHFNQYIKYSETKIGSVDGYTVYSFSDSFERTNPSDVLQIIHVYRNFYMKENAYKFICAEFAYDADTYSSPDAEPLIYEGFLEEGSFETSPALGNVKNKLFENITLLNGYSTIYFMKPKRSFKWDENWIENLLTEYPFLAKQEASSVSLIPVSLSGKPVVLFSENDEISDKYALKFTK